MDKRAFTLIELMVVVAIILILVGLLMVGAQLVRKRQVVANARIQMQGIGLALNSYLSDYGILGDLQVETPTDFDASPAVFLVVRPMLSKRTPYLSTELKSYTNAAGNPITTARDAGKIIDPWGQPLRFAVTNARSSAGRPFDHTSVVEMRSTAGTTAADDDLVYRYALDQDSWVWK